MRAPLGRAKAAEYVAVARANNRECVGFVVAFLVECRAREAVLAATVDELPVRVEGKLAEFEKLVSLLKVNYLRVQPVLN